MDRIRSVRFFDGFRLLAEVDDVVVIYDRIWHSYGKFEIHLSSMRPYVREGVGIMFDRDESMNGVIKHISKTDDGSVVIKGYSLLWLLGSRITVPEEGEDCIAYEDMPMEDIMKDLVRRSAAECQNVKRVIPGMRIAVSLGRGDRISYQTCYDNLMDVLEELSLMSMLGISVRMDLTNREYVFDVAIGRDRSIQQNTLPPVIFRKAYDNIVSQEYTLNDINTRTCAYTAGEKESGNRTMVVVGDEFEGFARKEVYVEAGSFTDEKELVQRGLAQLAECVRQECSECVVQDSGYQKRWDLGDTVTFIDDDTGNEMTHYISAVQVTQDVNGYDVRPTFGIPEASISERKW